MTSTAILLALVLAPAVAWPCSPPEPTDTMYPRFGERELPSNAWVYLDSSEAEGSLSSVFHPDGEEVDWVHEAAPFDPSMDRIRPQGGWRLGTYTRIDNLVNGESRDGWTLVEEPDETPPVFEEVSWSGLDPSAPAPCSGEEPARVELNVDLDETAVVLWERRDADGEVVEEGRLHAWEPTIPTAGIETFDLALRAIDLAGNETGFDAVSVTSCSGCSGSLAGAAFGGLAPMLLLIGRRRR